jgi:hypothetical protein
MVAIVMAALFASSQDLGAAQVGGPQTPADPVDAVMTNRQVRHALDLARESEPRTIADQIRFCETPAPPLRESARAELLKRAFLEVGLSSVYQDRAGNVIGSRPGTAVRPRVMIAAHLDTVFPEGTAVLVRRVGRTLVGPGIGDNCRGLAVLVAVARALRGAARVTGISRVRRQRRRRGLGNLRGVRELFGVASGAAARRILISSRFNRRPGTARDQRGRGRPGSVSRSRGRRAQFRGVRGVPSPVAALLAMR